LDAIRRLEKFVVDGLAWDSIPPTSVRTCDGRRPGLAQHTREYVESWDKKKERIVLSMMSFVGSSPENIVSFWFNPALLESYTSAVRKMSEAVGGGRPIRWLAG